MSFSAQCASVPHCACPGRRGPLKPDVSNRSGAGRLNRLARDGASVCRQQGEGIIVNTLMNEVVGNVRPALLTLLGAVALVS